MYGAMQAAPAGPSEQTTAQVQALTRAAAQGRYPNLAAALADAGPPRRHDDIFRSGIERLIETARLRLRRPQISRWLHGNHGVAGTVAPGSGSPVDADLVAGGPLRAVEAADTMVPPRDRRDRAATSGISRGAALRPGIQWSRPGGDAGIR